MNLHQAVENGDFKKVEELLAAGAAVDERDADGKTPLMTAATYDQPKAFRALLDAGADPHAVDVHGESVLHHTVSFGTPTLVRLLLEKKPDVNARNSRGETPLHAAMSAPIVQLLIEAGADVNVRRNDGLTALDLVVKAREFSGRSTPSKSEQLLRAAGAGREVEAPTPPAAPVRLPPQGTGALRSPSAQDVKAFLTAAQTDDVEKLRALLEAGMPVDVRGRMGHTALHMAAQLGCPGTLQLLLKAGADREARTAFGYTALHLAAQEKKAAAVRALIAAGADVNALTESRSTPLMVAVLQGAVQAAEALLEAGAAVNARNRQDQTALSIAQSNTMKKLLRAAGADDRAAQPLPPTPVEALVEAAGNGDVARVRELLADGVPVDAHVAYGNTPLRQAVAGGRLDVVPVLLEAGADLHVRGGDGETLLHTAAESGSAVMVRDLVRRGLDVNDPNRDGFTPLMAAALNGQLDAARALLGAGANPNARGNDGLQRNKTALQFARQCEDRKQRRAMIELLTGAAASADPAEAASQATAGFAAAAEQPAFQTMLKVLAEVCDKPPAPWKKNQGVYACARPNATRLAQRYAGDAALQDALAEADSADERAGLLLNRLRAEVRAAGFQLIESEADQSPRSAKLLIFPTADKYAVIAARETDGANYGLSTQDLIAWLNEMEKDNPFVLTACGGDFVAGQFVNPVADAGRLAERMCEFCPDLIDGDMVESPGQVAELLQEQQGFFFWWD